jgi:LysM repeat protein
MKRKSITFLLLMGVFTSNAQNADVIKSYIDAYKDIAIAEMQRTGVPAAITLAQGIHESGAGRGELALTANNHFGIKCKSTWAGESVKHDDDAKGECFRKYPSAEDSYKDHSDFLKNSPRYAALFSIDPTDYAGWANGLKKAGYATNPKYPQVLIKLIEDYQLQDYTLIALGKQPVGNDTMNTTVVNSVTISDDFIIQGEIARKTDYPENEFKINDTKVLYVKKGTSFLAIAKQYDIDLSKIFEFNEMTQAEETEKDQLIYLQRKRKTGNNEFHIVQPGETLHDIAQAEAIRMESLLQLNWLKEGEMPAAGQTLSLKTKSPTVPKLAIKENYSLTGDNKPKQSN